MPALRIAAVGDIMLGDSPQVFGFGVASQIRMRGAHSIFEKVQPLLSEADLTLANLEVVAAPLPDSPRFGDRIYRGDPTSVAAVREAGVDVVSVCTNHMMQHGQTAFDACLRALVTAGLVVTGAEVPSHGLSRSALIERQGYQIRILSYNLRPIQYSAAPPSWPDATSDLMVEDLAQSRKEADLVIVTIHWGDEFINRPSAAQVRLAHELVDAGADIILGHHPHIVQGVERYQGAVISYSLGNFVYDQWQERLRRSMVLTLEVRDRREIDYAIRPVMIDHTWRPVPCEDAEREAELAVHQALARLIDRSDDAEYERELRQQYKRFRREVLFHYASRFWKFKPVDFADNLMEMVRRRV